MHSGPANAQTEIFNQVLVSPFTFAFGKDVCLDRRKMDLWEMTFPGLVEGFHFRKIEPQREMTFYHSNELMGGRDSVISPGFAGGRRAPMDRGE